MKRISVFKYLTVVLFFISISLLSHAEVTENPCKNADKTISALRIAGVIIEGKDYDKTNGCDISKEAKKALNSLLKPKTKTESDDDFKKRQEQKSIFQKNLRDVGVETTEDYEKKACKESKSAFNTARTEANKECSKIGGCGSKVDRCNDAIAEQSELDDDDDYEGSLKDIYSECPSLSREGLEKAKEDYEEIKESKEEKDESIKKSVEDRQQMTADHEERTNELQTNISKAKAGLEKYDAESQEKLSQMTRDSRNEFNRLVDRVEELDISSQALIDQFVEMEIEIGKAKRALQRECSEFASKMVTQKRESLIEQDYKAKRNGPRGGKAKRFRSNKNFAMVSTKSRVKSITRQIDYYYNQCIKGKTKKLQAKDLEDDLKQTRKKMRTEQRKLKKEKAKAERAVELASKDLPGMLGEKSNLYLKQRSEMIAGINGMQNQLLSMEKNFQKQQSSKQSLFMLDQQKQMQFTQEFEAKKRFYQLHDHYGKKELDAETTSAAMALYSGLADSALAVMNGCSCSTKCHKKVLGNVVLEECTAEEKVADAFDLSCGDDKEAPSLTLKNQR